MKITYIAKKLQPFQIQILLFIIVIIVGYRDPFLLQLVIIPIVVIGLGLLVSYILRKVIASRLLGTITAIMIAPIITFILNISFNYWSYMSAYGSKGEKPNMEFIFSWSVIFPTLSFIAACIMIFTLNVRDKR